MIAMPPANAECAGISMVPRSLMSSQPSNDGLGRSDILLDRRHNGFNRNLIMPFVPAVVISA